MVSIPDCLWKTQGTVVSGSRKDAELRRWLDWLAGSSNTRSAKMGRWYLRQLEVRTEPEIDGAMFAPPETEGKKRVKPSPGIGVAAIVVYINPELKQLRQLVAGARARLAELESSYTREKSRVDAMQAVLFRRLRSPGGISCSSDEHSWAFQREPNWTQCD